ncbi:2-amino-4-hydroxy-6-hydroxymethyldihydropteridine diphosphokinase [Raineya orbicola]|uniref:2-amino-4-hydroxy-6-hydroxymethyldihydropteridine pyrophosphokinase n=1 Tax=Raineya orbicola TaxID=2016530 RepID=A0A2N3IHG5_9BACT|nr:2-amino-4-hydroxy-6-hydroxymethyldihydropteridine diphosphokinase [Raineya orbicola]PKQ69800.1 folK: 2-amino-4-hydroxy-6-hydroxymethyldihydropteridine diphosphokinase [Raineya orbicola]
MRVFILLGSNEGNRVFFLKEAIRKLENLGKILKISSIYETKPWGNLEQANFLNCVLEMQTTLSAENLLTEILSIEKSLGRERKTKWQARTIDIDILYFGNLIIQSENLQIPHPFLHQRRFTLVPLVEIASDFLHPVFQKNNQELLQECSDMLEVWLYEFEKPKL